MRFVVTRVHPDCMVHRYQVIQVCLDARSTQEMYCIQVTGCKSKVISAVWVNFIGQVNIICFGCHHIRYLPNAGAGREREAQSSNFK